MGLAITKDAVA